MLAFLRIVISNCLKATLYLVNNDVYALPKHMGC